MPGHFPTDADLLALAATIVGGYVNRLRDDVRHCIETAPGAPFPALLFALATVDALGALAAGRADRDAPTTTNAAAYLYWFMGYTAEEVRLVQQLFRHKLTHLAEPRPILRDGAGRL